MQRRSSLLPLEGETGGRMGFIGRLMRKSVSWPETNPPAPQVKRKWWSLTSTDTLSRTQSAAAADDLRRLMLGGSDAGGGVDARVAGELDSVKMAVPVFKNAVEAAGGEDLGPERGQPQGFVDNQGARFLIDKIIMHEIRLGSVLYKVRWQGYGAADDTWEPESAFIQQHGGRNAIAAYRARRAVVDQHARYAKRLSKQGRNDPLPCLEATTSVEASGSPADSCSFTSNFHRVSSGASAAATATSASADTKSTTDGGVQLGWPAPPRDRASKSPWLFLARPRPQCNAPDACACLTCTPAKKAPLTPEAAWMLMGRRFFKANPVRNGRAWKQEEDRPSPRPEAGPPPKAFRGGPENTEQRLGDRKTARAHAENRKQEDDGARPGPRGRSTKTEGRTDEGTEEEEQVRRRAQFEMSVQRRTQLEMSFELGNFRLMRSFV